MKKYSIIRAVKCAATKDQIKPALDVARRTGITALEIHGLPQLMGQDYVKRAQVFLDERESFTPSRLVYHMPLRDAYYNLEDGQRADLGCSAYTDALYHTESIIQEAGLVGATLSLDEVLINVHILGYVGQQEVSLETRHSTMKHGEKNIRTLKEMADHYGNKFGCKLSIVRENNPLDHGNVLGITDFDPRDTMRTIGDGIGVTFDFAHYWQYVYWTGLLSRDGEFPGAGLCFDNTEIMPWEEVIALIAPHLRLIHMNDSSEDFTKSGEGLEIGTGIIPHKQLIPYIITGLTQDIIGVYELKTGHIEQEQMYRSDQYYRELFGKKFNEYFI